ncbi:MAG: transcription elongation factor GreAB [Zetaproteobacteria bacterium CG2_30_46_52]|nr:MAG: transcription elongation factor GreAB [Zetaproteobacteria bacterium CG2_30_46_52]
MFDSIQAKLSQDIIVAAEAVKIARDTATHKDCLGSSKYETMGTEASYLAQGQGVRLLELERALAYFKQLALIANKSASLGAIVCLESEEGIQQTFCLAADSGGLQVVFAQQTITVITPQSPMGRAMFGKAAGDSFTLTIAGKTLSYELLMVY